MYFMEAALGQFGQVGPLQVWSEMLPCAMGVGVAMVIISLIVAIYSSYRVFQNDRKKV